MARLDLSSLQVGDLLNFERNRYKHWAVYVGAGEVVHLVGKQPETSGGVFEQARVVQESLETVAGTGSVQVVPPPEKSSDPETIRKRALDKVGAVVFYVDQKANEGFARSCCTGDDSHLKDYAREGAPFPEETDPLQHGVWNPSSQVACTPLQVPQEIRNSSPSKGTRMKPLVVAIDFGTTYSGYAYSFRSDFQSNPLQVHHHNLSDGGVQVAKVPTSVLFTPDKRFHSFGREAEEKYAKLCDDDRREAPEWFYFERFKMELHKNLELSRDTTLLDQTQKKGMPALEVFSAAIRFLKDHFTAALAQKRIRTEEADITWVLTVPAIWEDKARQFMREAAEKAGIPDDQLMLALEPEAASIYCLRHFQSSVSPSESKKRFMMADCGGGTIDISLFETNDNQRLRQLHKPKGTADGGTQVDKAFQTFLNELVGFEGLASFDKMEMLKLSCAFEQAKRSDVKSDKVAIDIPLSVLETFSVYAAESEKYRGKVSVVKNKLLLHRDIFLSFFQKSAHSITQSIEDVLKSEGVGHVDAILLAGGFSECDVIQKAVKEAFPRDLVLVAPSPSAAVLTGAVMFGHKPDVIATRVSAFTYGVQTRSPFKDGVHDEARRVTDEDGDVLSEDCFSVYITMDQEVEVNTLLPYRAYFPTKSDLTEMRINNYRSTRREPLYVDEEGSEEIGSVTVLMPDTTGGRKRKVKEAMMVGGTELKFFATDETTGKEFSTKCDFLCK